MIIAMVYRAVTQTNYFPAANGISQYFSPLTIMHKNMIDYDNIKIPFGAYVPAHNKPVQKNSMMPRTLDCVYLRSVKSPYGGHEMLHLLTNQIIRRKHISIILMTQNIIKLVHTIAKKKENMPVGLKLNNWPNDIIIAGVDTVGMEKHITTYDTEDYSNSDEDNSIQLEHIDVWPKKTQENIDINTSNETIKNKYILENINHDDQSQDSYHHFQDWKECNSWIMNKYYHSKRMTWNKKTKYQKVLYQYLWTR